MAAPLRLPLSYHHEIALILRRRDDELTLTNVRVDLGTHADLAGNVDAGLDRERDARNEQPLLARLEVVNVRTGAVEVARVNGVSGAVREPIPESCRGDDVARGIVCLAAAHGDPAGDALPEQRDG